MVSRLKYLRCLITSFCFFIFASSDTWATSGFAYSDEWLAIGHYQANSRGYESTIDTSNFFLSENGKFNPKSELEATIALFQSNDDKTKCLFPARYKLLTRLGIINYEFPNCDDLEQFYKDLQPSGITFLFTDAYMNNPSSLFGHTLLRIDTKRKGTQLLAHGANYGAFTGETLGALYPILGIFGGYYGGFTVKPYYDIINTYNNIENRDIWELELDFSEVELDFFVAHLWEVGQAQSRYYFFGRNCSYMLMEMFDAIRPSLRLAEKFKFQTIPLDTFKAVYNNKNLVKKVNYRPSRQNKIRYAYNFMQDKNKKAFLEIINEQKYEINDLTIEDKAQIYETAYQYLQYQYVAEKLNIGDYRKQSFKLLQNRSKLANFDSGTEHQMQGSNPAKAHEAKRLRVVGGWRNGVAFQEMAFRPAYHSLTDDNYGFLRGAEINFLNTTLRHYDKDNKYVLHKFELLGIRSIAPIDKMFTPVSFQILADVSREMKPDDEKEGYVANLIIGGGGTYALKDNLWLFAMVNNHLAYGGFLPRNQWGGVGLQLGALLDIGKWRALIETEKIYATSKIGAKTIYKAEVVYSLNHNWALEASCEYKHNYVKDIEELGVGFRSYF